MAHRTDAVTRWWHGISLRTKVTAVTVSLLALALLTAGSGTYTFLHSTLESQVDATVLQLVVDDIANDVFDSATTGEDSVEFTAREFSSSRPYFVTIYDPDGEKVITTGGNGATPPTFPKELTPEMAATLLGSARELPGSGHAAAFRYAVHSFVVDIQPHSKRLYTQLVAAPLAPTERLLANFIGIYSVLSLLIILGIALLTRWLVTLTFRSLAQVETTAMSIAQGDFSQRMTDIEPRTEVGRLKRAINVMLDRIDAAISQRDATVKQMRRFIGDASHELRTPLVTVRGYAELYRMGGISDEENTAQAMSRIEKEAIRMGLLVEDLLALARLDERKDLTIAPVDLLMIAHDAALDVRAAAPQRPIIVVDDLSAEDAVLAATTAPITLPRRSVRQHAVESPEDANRTGALSLLRRRPRPFPAPRAEQVPEIAVVPQQQTQPTESVMVWGDENRVRQVVANLLGNARRFTVESSPIELHVGVDFTAERGWIEVVDHGEGIPDQVKDKIFQRFWRADTSRTRETGGTGLGLSIVASIVDALKGTVIVTNTPGGGASFKVSLPLALPEPPAPTDTSAPSRP